MELIAPSHWRCIDFLSDIHLDAAEPATFTLWQAYLANTPADAVFILGDLFALWVGDDALNLQEGFEHQCVSALKAVGNRLSLFIMVGNRDFLMGAALMAECSARSIEDPCTLVFDNQRFVLSHGDALCAADTEYQAFRTMVRSPQWQNHFLDKRLTERQAIARSIRTQSESKKNSGTPYADVDSHSALALLKSNDADILIHGHTHRPGQVNLPNGKSRLVLSDWVANAVPPRADVLRLQANGTSGPTVTRLSAATIANGQD
jgi:UDP-2,3-diacylglucosamine hydrolase